MKHVVCVSSTALQTQHLRQCERHERAATWKMYRSVMTSPQNEQSLGSA